MPDARGSSMPASWEYLMPKRKERMALFTRESDLNLATGTTIESAAKAAREHGERQGYIYDPDLDWREAISSVEVPYNERKKLLEMLDAAKKKKFDVLVVSEIRAISRRQVEVLVIYDLLQKYGVRLETIKEKFGEDAMSKAILSLRAMFVEIEVEQSKMRMARGRMDRILIGQAPNAHAKAAYGYCFVNTKAEVKGAYVLNHTIVWVDETGKEWSEYAVAMLIFKLVKEGDSLHKVCRVLNDLKIPTSYQFKAKDPAKTYWQRGSVYSIVTNPIYCGEVWANKYRKIKSENGKHTIRLRPREEWIRLPNSPAIITKDEFEAIQLQLTANKEESIRNNKQKRENLGLLRSGYIFCGICGRRMQSVPPSPAARRNGNTPYYGCANFIKDTTGRQRHRTQIGIPMVDREVRLLIVEILKDPLWCRERVKELRKKQEKPEPVVTREDIQTTIDGVKQSLKRLYRLAEHAEDDDTLDDLAVQMNALEKKKRAAEMLLFDLSDNDEHEEELEKEIVRFEIWAKQVRPNLSDPNYQASYQELRLAIRVLGIRAIVYPTIGEWPWRCKIDTMIPEIMRKLDGDATESVFLEKGSSVKDRSR